MVAGQLDGCGQFMKYSLFFVNFVIFVLGLSVCGLGIWTLVDSSGVEHIIGNNLYIPAAAILVTFGGVVALISFLGCCGAIKEVKCLLALFFVIMLLLSIVIALGAIFGFVVGTKLGDGIDEVMQESLEEYGDGVKAQPLTDAWDDIQKKLECCGISSSADWALYNDAFKGDVKFPASCCKSGFPNCQTETKTVEDKHYTEGCKGAVEKFVMKHIKPLAAIGIAIAIIIVLSMIFSCALCLMI